MVNLVRHFCALLAIAAWPACLSAQSADTLSTPIEDDGPESPAKAYALGAGVGLGGFFAGGLVGLALTSGCQGDDYCGLEGFLIAAGASRSTSSPAPASGASGSGPRRSPIGMTRRL
jgi:hypothetical protein